MLSNWPIRTKFLVGLGLLLLLMVVLAGSGLYATYAYRSLVKTLSWRSVELPLAGALSGHVANLRIGLGELRGIALVDFCPLDAVAFNDPSAFRVRSVRDTFRGELAEFERTLARYRRQLEHKGLEDLSITDTQLEWATVRKIEAALTRVHQAERDEDWVLNNVKVEQLDAELANLERLTAELPSHLHHRLGGFAAEVRATYRTLIVGTWVVSLAAAVILAIFIRLFYRWVFLPLRILVGGSRQVAAGNFGYRIHLDTCDEMSELAEAMNDMTERFQAIRDDLDHQVQERTKQVVRNERLASVGFLAAGVAHEINNPLASIAMCAESLVGRVSAELDPADPRHEVVFQYLDMIQNEAFRCKEITEKLLDFSRTGPIRRQAVELGGLLQGVIDMVRHLGRYRGTEIELEAAEPVFASINPQEIKQVVLNLLTNALDSLEAGGRVRISLAAREGFAELTFIDNGCGMDVEVQEHLFEPFFTRRRSGQGTGLGLSISYRIVSDHGGEITAESPGPGLGSIFRVRLPLAAKTREIDHHCHAA